MWKKRKNRKNKKYLKFVGIVFIFFGILLVLVSFLILISPVIFKSSIISPLAKNFKQQIDKKEEIGNLLSKSNISVSSISIATDSSYMIFLTDNGAVIMSSSKDIAEQVRSLQIILSRLTIEGKRFKTLDFRFGKPVLAF